MATPITKGWSGDDLFQSARRRTDEASRGYGAGQGTNAFGDTSVDRGGLSDLLARWQQEEAKRLGLDGGTDGRGGIAGGGATDVGTVYRGSAIGQFAQYPGVDDEIQQAARTWGIPVNFLKAIIAHESSGDWNDNNYVNTTARPEMGELLPYIGVFKVAADSRGLGELYQQARTGDRGAQINLLAAVLASQAKDVLAQNPTYGWLNVAAYHYSGDPSGNSTPADSYQYGTAQQYMANIESWWKLMDTEAGNTWNNGIRVGGEGPAGGMSSLGGEWAGVDRWNSQIAAAAAKTGVDANLIKAVMRLESNGDAGSISPQGATGLMQIMPFWNGTNGLQITNPAQNIELGATILKQNYQRYGSWDMAVKAYLGLGGADAYGTTADSYLARVKQYQAQLATGPTSGWAGQPPGSGIAGIWGNSGIPQISQELGPTEWSQGAGAWMYGYAAAYGVEGHTGIDYSMVPGGMLYAPTSGTVEIAGWTPYFTDERYGATPQTGELYIRLDNGDVLILGHMQHISVKVGDRVTAGSYVGQSGTYNGGHVHVEYRTPDPSTESGWRIVDPRTYLRTEDGGQRTVSTPRAAMSYRELVRAYS